YGIKVRKKLNNGVYCYAKEKVPLENGLFGLGEETIRTAKLTQPERKLQIEYVNVVEPTAFGNNNGSIKARIEGGTMFDDNTYEFAWHNSEGDPILTDFETDYQFGQGYFITLKNIPADTYYLTVWDKNYSQATYTQGCTILNSVKELIQPEPLSLIFEEAESISCFNDENGELIAHASGGVELEITDNNGLPYYYTWKKKNEQGAWITLSET